MCLLFSCREIDRIETFHFEDRITYSVSRNDIVMEIVMSVSWGVAHFTDTFITASFSPQQTYGVYDGSSFCSPLAWAIIACNS